MMSEGYIILASQEGHKVIGSRHMLRLQWLISFYALNCLQVWIYFSWCNLVWQELILARFSISWKWCNKIKFLTNISSFISYSTIISILLWCTALRIYPTWKHKDLKSIKLTAKLKQWFIHVSRSWKLWIFFCWRRRLRFKPGILHEKAIIQWLSRHAK